MVNYGINQAARNFLSNSEVPLRQRLITKSEVNYGKECY